MTPFSALQLPDGRLLEYFVSGPAGGLPLVFHHGTPGVGAPYRAVERAAHQRGLRVVCPTRPGYGRSSRKAGRSVADVVADTEAVLADLGAERCLVSGWSGGGPHAMACAARLTSAAGALVIAGIAPHGAPGLEFLAGMGEDNITEFSAAERGETDLRAFLDTVWPALKDITADAIVASMESLLPPVDRAVLGEEIGEDLATSFREGLRPGVDGWLDDDLAFVSPWGFELEEITVPMSLWQGSEDLMVPFAHGQWFAGRLPAATAHLENGEGHLSIGLGAIGRALDELIAAAALS